MIHKIEQHFWGTRTDIYFHYGACGSLMCIYLCILVYTYVHMYDFICAHIFTNPWQEFINTTMHKKWNENKEKTNRHNCTHKLKSIKNTTCCSSVRKYQVLKDDNDFNIDIHDVVDNVDSNVDWMVALLLANSSAGDMSKLRTQEP